MYLHWSRVLEKHFDDVSFETQKYVVLLGFVGLVRGPFC